MILCKQCGWPVYKVEANCFERDGSDLWYTFLANNEGDNAVCFSLPTAWCGTDLSEEEQADCIRCAHCKKFPFSETLGINVEQIVNVVCFEEGYHERID